MRSIVNPSRYGLLVLAGLVNQIHHPFATLSRQPLNGENGSTGLSRTATPYSYSYRNPPDSWRRSIRSYATDIDSPSSSNVHSSIYPSHAHLFVHHKLIVSRLRKHTCPVLTHAPFVRLSSVIKHKFCHCLLERQDVVLSNGNLHCAETSRVSDFRWLCAERWELNLRTAFFSEFRIKNMHLGTCQTFLPGGCC